MSPMPTDARFLALASGIIDSRLAFQWLSLDIELGRDALTSIESCSKSFINIFEFVKALPLDVIPASLHPVN